MAVIKNGKSRIYLVYYLLAALDLITISGSLYLNHRLVDNYQKSVQVNKQWAERAQNFANLSLLAGEVNAPGNDVFDSRDVQLEKARMEKHRVEFFKKLEELEIDIEKNVQPREAAKLKVDLLVIQKAMQGMLVEAEEIFEFFARNQPDAAAQRMATMDRKYAVVNKSIEAVRSQISAYKREYLERQSRLAEQLSHYEYLLVFGVFFIIFLVTVYGRKLTRSFLDLSEEKEKFYSELNAYKIALDEHSIVSVSDLKGTITYANNKFCLISQYSREELLGKNHNIVNSGYHPREFWVNMWKTIASGQVWHAQVKNKAKDGSFYWVDATIVPFRDSQGKITQYFSIRTDITVSKTQEEEIVRAKDAAEAANKLKSQFLANMSHEIRTPMNAVLGFSDLLNRTKLDEKQRGFLKVILSSGQLLLMIINDILDFSKFQAGKVRLESIDFDLEYLLGDSFKLTQSKLEGKNIHAFIDIAPDVPRHLKGDPTRLKQILINLLTNAIKFTEKGEAGIRVVLKENVQDGSDIVLEFSVIDSGIGIPKEKVANLFQAFEQADMSTTRKYGGTGLGLAICKALVEAMGGNISIESRVGKGTRFIFTVRLQRGDDVSLKLQPLSLDKLAGKKIFIVDDNQHARELLVRYLEESQFKVVACVESVVRALRVLEELMIKDGCPDLIITDIMMPEQDGHMFIRKIREAQKTKDIKVLAISSDIHVGVSQELQKEGFDGFLSKPYTRQELTSVIATLLGVGYERAKSEIITRHKAQENNFSGLHLLVVDDVEANRLLMKAYIDMLGCTADYVSNGQEAIDALKNGGRYFLCLMDMQMPVMDGETATRLIRKDIDPNLPIIALTAAVLKEDEERCRAVGMNDFLAKPIDVEKLRGVLQKFSNLYGRQRS